MFHIYLLIQEEDDGEWKSLSCQESTFVIPGITEDPVLAGLVALFCGLPLLKNIPRLRDERRLDIVTTS